MSRAGATGHGVGERGFAQGILLAVRHRDPAAPYPIGQRDGAAAQHRMKARRGRQVGHPAGGHADRAADLSALPVEIQCGSTVVQPCVGQRQYRRRAARGGAEGPAISVRCQQWLAGSRANRSRHCLGQVTGAGMKRRQRDAGAVRCLDSQLSVLPRHLRIVGADAGIAQHGVIEVRIQRKTTGKALGRDKDVARHNIKIGQSAAGQARAQLHGRAVLVLRRCQFRHRQTRTMFSRHLQRCG